MTSSAVGNSPRPSRRGRSTAPPRPTAWRSRPRQAAPRRSRSAASASPTRPWWCVFPSPKPLGPGARHAREEVRNLPEAPARPGIEDDDGLRTAGQRVDRGRQTASARPLRDLIVREANSESVGWAKAHLRRAHHLSSSALLDGGHAVALPTLRGCAIAMGNCDKSTCEQITSDFPKSCQARESKIFCFRSHANHRITPPVSRQMRGVGHRHERAVRCDGRKSCD